MPSTSLTYRECEVLDFIMFYIHDKDPRGPMFSDIAEHLQLKGRGAIYRTLNSLRDKGYLRWTAHKRRSFEVLYADGSVYSAADTQKRQAKAQEAARGRRQEAS